MRRFFWLLLIGLLYLPEATALPPLHAQTATPEQTRTDSGLLRPLKQTAVAWNSSINREINQRMTALKKDPSPLLILSSLLVALLYGVLHTLGPGHGKTVITSYLLTHGAGFWRSTAMAGQVAISHVASAIVIVLTTHAALHQFLTQNESIN